MSDEHLFNRLRAFCDGELPPDEAAALERRIEADPQLRAAVRFERQLRERVGVVLGSAPELTPIGLSNRIRAALREPATESDPAETPVDENVVTGRVDATGAARRPEPARQPWFAAPKRANVFAVAATLLLVATVVMVGIFGPRIDSLPIGSSNDLVGRTARFAAKIHGACETDREAMRDKLVWLTPDETVHRLTAHLDGHPVEVFDLSEFGFVFNGGGRCRVPGEEPSGHLIYTRPASSSAEEMILSIFVVADTGQYDNLVPDFRPNQWFRFDGGPECSRSVVGITDGDVVYLMVCAICDADSRAIKFAIAEQLLTAGDGR